MIKILLLFIVAIITISISSKLLLASNEITILIGDYQIALSQGFLIIIIILFTATIVITLLFLFKILHSRELFLIKQKNKNFDKSLNYLTNYIIHNATSDYDNAAKIIKKLDKTINNHSLLKLLHLQHNKATGKDISKDLKKLLKDNKTKLFALQGLYLNAKNNNNHKLSLEYLEQAYEYAPNIHNNVVYLAESYIENQDWPKAIKHIEKNIKKRLLQKKDYKTYLALSYFVIFKKSNNDENLLKSYKLFPKHPQIEIEYANYLFKNNKIISLTSLIKKSIKHNYNRELIDLFVTINNDKSIKLQLDKLNKLIKTTSYNESVMIKYAELSYKYDLNIQNTKNLLKTSLHHSNSKQIYKISLEFFRKHQENSNDIEFYEDLLKQEKYYDFSIGYFCNNCKKEAKNWQINCSECASFDKIRFSQDCYGSTNVR